MTELHDLHDAYMKISQGALDSGNAPRNEPEFTREAAHIAAHNLVKRVHERAAQLEKRITMLRDQMDQAKQELEFMHVLANTLEPFASEVTLR